MKCRICANEEGNVEYKVHEMMSGSRDEFGYFECAKCGCLQIAEFPSDIAKYYGEGYYSFGGSPEEYYSSALANKVRGIRDASTVLGKGLAGKLIFRLIPNDLPLPMLRRAGLTKRSRILDVGCGAGWLIYALKNAGFENVEGADPFIEREVVYKNGLKIAKKRIEDVEGKFDFVMFNHALEHIGDQHSAMRAVHRILDDNGTCMVRIPVASSYAWEHYRTNWVQLDAPRHFFIHSVKSIERLASDTGFSLKDISYDSTSFQFWGSEQYLKGISLNSERSYDHSHEKSIFSKKDIESFEARARALNDEKRGDQAAFYLKKRNADAKIINETNSK